VGSRALRTGPIVVRRLRPPRRSVSTPTFPSSVYHISVASTEFPRIRFVIRAGVSAPVWRVPHANPLHNDRAKVCAVGAGPPSVPAGCAFASCEPDRDLTGSLQAAALPIAGSAGLLAGGIVLRIGGGVTDGLVGF